MESNTLKKQMASVIDTIHAKLKEHFKELEALESLVIEKRNLHLTNNLQKTPQDTTGKTIGLSSKTSDVDNFDNMRLKEELLRGIYSKGFEKPSAIQKRAILPCIEGNDAILQTQYATGKIATFSISILLQIDTNVNECQAIILVPTRILTQKIQKEVTAFGQFMKVDCYACSGGTRIEDDKQKLVTGPHVVVGTPGRIYKMIALKSLRTQFLKTLVVDERGELFTQIFKDQIKEVFRFISNDVQVILLTGTISESVLDVSSYFMNFPLLIFAPKTKKPLEGIQQFYIDVVKDKWKLGALYDLFENLKFTQSVIFCNTRSQVMWVTRDMSLKNYIVSTIHGKINQPERKALINKFGSGSIRTLITTDIIRSIAEKPKSLVINFDLPTKLPDYFQRAKCFGNKGITINFVTGKDKKFMKVIESFYNTRVLEMSGNINSVLNDFFD